MANSNLVQSLLRGLDILQIAADSDNGVTLAELAEKLNTKPTTVHNLARTLMARGFITKESKPVRYKLGPAAIELAAGARRRNFLHKAQQATINLAEKLPSATVTITEPVAGEIVVKLRISPERPGICQRPQNLAMSPYSNASTLLFQALWDGQRRHEYQNRYPFWEYASQIWQSQEQLEKFLDEVRARGYAQLRIKPEMGFLLAVPIVNEGQELIAALGIRLPAEYNDPEKQKEVIAIAKETVTQLTLSL